MKTDPACLVRRSPRGGFSPEGCEGATEVCIVLCADDLVAAVECTLGELDDEVCLREGEGLEVGSVLQG